MYTMAVCLCGHSADHWSSFPRYLVDQLSVMCVPSACYGHYNDYFALDVHTNTFLFPFCRSSEVAALMCLCSTCTTLVPIMDLGLSHLPPPLATIKNTLLSG